MMMKIRISLDDVKMKKKLEAEAEIKSTEKNNRVEINWKTSIRKTSGTDFEAFEI